VKLVISTTASTCKHLPANSHFCSSVLSLSPSLPPSVRKHRTIFPTSIHAALGFLVCALLVLQVLAGLEKLDAQRSGVVGRGGGREGGIHKWHGKTGLLLYDVSMMTVITGLGKSLGWGMMSFFIVMHVILLWVLVHLQMVSKPFRPTGEGGLTERELVELRRDGGGEGGGEGGGRGPRGSMGGRKDSNGGEIGESL